MSNLAYITLLVESTNEDNFEGVKQNDKYWKIILEKELVVDIQCSLLLKIWYDKYNFIHYSRNICSDSNSDCYFGKSAVRKRDWKLSYYSYNFILRFNICNYVNI